MLSPSAGACLSPPAMSVETRPVLYLNLIIHDGSEAVKDRVAKKVEQCMLPGPMRRVAAKHAGQAASDFTNPRILAAKMGQKMCRALPEKMKEKGVTVEMEEVFREANYVVLRLQVVHVDTVAAAGAKSKKDGNDDNMLAGLIHWFLELMGSNYQQMIEDDYLPNMVMKELAITMPKLLEEKLIKIKVKAETMALKEKNQARYFYAKLRDVRLEEELRKDKNRMYGIRKRISPNPNGSSSEFAAFAADDCSSMASGSTRAESVCDSRKSRTEIIEKLKTGSTRAESACDSRKSRTETIEKLKTEPIEKRGSVVRTRSTEKLKTELIEKRSSIVRTRSYKNMFDGQTSSRI